MSCSRYLLNPLTGGQLGDRHSDFIIVEWSDDGQSGAEWIAPLHLHHRDDEAWCVLTGTMRFRVGNDTFEAGQGDAVFAPRGVPHAYGNARPGEHARYLLCMTPRIRSLIEALHAPGADEPAVIFADHESELLG